MTGLARRSAQADCQRLALVIALGLMILAASFYLIARPPAPVSATPPAGPAAWSSPVQAGATGAAPSAAEASLKQFLQSLDKDKTTRYVAAFRDLNGDGIPEAIVYLIGSEWCGSGGCNTLILTRNDSSWRTVTEISITQLPIRVLTNTSHGWRSLGVWVQGGGIRSGYEAELRFNGKSYPRNPSVPPARQLKEKPAGEVVIASERGATPLW